MKPLASYLGFEDLGFPPRLMQVPGMEGHRVISRHGVPCGSVLAPMLFNLAVRNIPNSATGGITVPAPSAGLKDLTVSGMSYADDIRAFATDGLRGSVLLFGKTGVAGVVGKLAKLSQMVHVKKFEAFSSLGPRDVEDVSTVGRELRVTGMTIPATGSIKLLGSIHVHPGETAQSGMPLYAKGARAYLGDTSHPIDLRVAHVTTVLCTKAIFVALAAGTSWASGSLAKGFKGALCSIIGAQLDTSLSLLLSFFGVWDIRVLWDYHTGLFALYTARWTLANHGVVFRRMMMRTWRQQHERKQSGWWG